MSKASEQPVADSSQEALDATTQRVNERNQEAAAKQHIPKHQHAVTSVESQGGAVVVSNFHLLHTGVELGQDNNALSSHVAGHIKTLKFTTKDAEARKKLASILQVAAARLME
jgi:hypothetical protein